MHDITCLDNYGNVIHYFTQWDLNQKIYIEDSGFTTAPLFHFENKKSNLSVVKQSSIDSNGILSVSVPNEFTITSLPIDIYIYSSTGNISSATHHVTIPVYPRKQPNDLISENDIEFLAISELEKKIKILKGMIDGFSFNAKDISYSNTISGLTATNVQDAIDEIVENYVFVDKLFDDGDFDDGNVSRDTLYLYDNGITLSDLGEWATFSQYGTSTILEENNHLYFNIPDNSEGDIAYIRSENMFNTSDYSTLYIEYTYIGETVFNLNPCEIWLTTESSSCSGKGLTLDTNNGTFTDSIDISDCNNMNVYLRANFYTRYYSGKFYNTTWKIHKIWLEKNTTTEDEDDGSGDNADVGEILYLYNEGDECVDITGGWGCSLASDLSHNTKEESYIEMCLGKGDSDTLLISAYNDVSYVGYKTLGIMYDYIGDDTIIDTIEYIDESNGILYTDDISIPPLINNYDAKIRIVNGNNNISYVDLEDYNVSDITNFWFGDITGNINKTQDAVLRIRKIWLDTSVNKNLEVLKQVETLFKEAIDSYIDYNTTLPSLNELLNSVLAQNRIIDINFGLTWLNVINDDGYTSYTEEVSIGIPIEYNGLNRYLTLDYSLPSIAEKVSTSSVVIKEAVDNMVVTNITTQSDIQIVVNNALVNAKITDVAATVGEITKTEATTSTTGLITGNIAIVVGRSNSVVGYCSINKTIELLS